MLNSRVEELLFSNETILERVKELGEQISTDYQGKELVVVGVLTGSVLFTSDLIRHISLPMELDFVALASYGASTKTSGVVQILKDLGHSVENKHVLIIEDIIDTGLTLNFLLNSLKTRNPASVKTCVLLDKPSRRKVDAQVEYCGFKIEDRFVVGYGLDYAGHYRNLPYIGVLSLLDATEMS